MNESFKNTVFEEDMKDLKLFFEMNKPPQEPIKLDQCTTIIDVTLFIQSHLKIIESHSRNVRFRPYLDRLIQFKNSINLK
jgi:hypothetical protein